MTKKLRKSRIVTYSSTDRFPKTRATARRNRSKATTWLLKDRGNAWRSHARSRGKTRNPGAKTKEETPQAKFFPLTSATPLPKWCTLKALCTTSFSKIKQVSPLFDHFSQNSPPCWHMHTSSLKRPKAPPEAKTPPEQMLCHECNAEGVSESIQGYKDMSNI